MFCAFGFLRLVAARFYNHLILSLLSLTQVIILESLKKPLLWWLCKNFWKHSLHRWFLSPMFVPASFTFISYLLSAKSLHSMQKLCPFIFTRTSSPAHGEPLTFVAIPLYTAIFADLCSPWVVLLANRGQDNPAAVFAFHFEIHSLPYLMV